MHYHLQIQGTTAYACGESGGTMLRLENLQLNQQTEIQLKGKKYTLEALVQQLVTHSNSQTPLWDDREQLEIGQYLYTQTIAQLPANEQNKLRNTPEVQLHISSPDEHITRLPWVLLAREQDFLTTCGWSILLSSLPFAQIDATSATFHSPLRIVELPPTPRLLVVAPQANDVPDTDAEIHLTALQTTLSNGDRHLVWDKRLRRVATWDEFIRVLPQFEPDLIYYYGHGVGTVHRADLIFEYQNGASIAIPVADFAQCINQLSRTPLLIYVNCCYGDAAGFLGIGRQINAPAVLTNRTVANINAAQTQAITVWENIILKGHAPYIALQQVYQRTAELHLSHNDLRWMTHVLYGNYYEWRANPPKPAKHWVADKYWHLKVDHINSALSLISPAKCCVTNAHVV